MSVRERLHLIIQHVVVDVLCRQTNSQVYLLYSSYVLTCVQ